MAATFGTLTFDPTDLDTTAPHGDSAIRTIGGTTDHVQVLGSPSPHKTFQAVLSDTDRATAQGLHDARTVATLTDHRGQVWSAARLWSFKATQLKGTNYFACQLEFKRR